MTTEWLSGGFIIALAAVLWLVYLVPSWFRSRQYLATERNAVRLQQTLRILAETSELPEEVRVEANARSIAEQERILKHRAVERELDAVPAAVRTADRLRRSRAVTAVVLVLSLSVAVLGGMQAVYTGAWIILVGGAIASTVSIAMLVRLSRAGRRLRLPRPAERESPVFHDQADHDGAEPGDAWYDDGRSRAHLVAVESGSTYAADTGDQDAGTTAQDESGWVPVAIPRPLYLSRASLPPLEFEDAEVGDADAEEGDAHAEVGTVAVPDRALATSGSRLANTAHGQGEHHEELRRAAAAAEENLRARLQAQHQSVAELPSVPVETPAARTPAAAASAAAPAAPPSRFARMGIVEGDTEAHLDLDEILARRRAG